MKEYEAPSSWSGTFFSYGKEDEEDMKYLTITLKELTQLLKALYEKWKESIARY